MASNSKKFPLTKVAIIGAGGFGREILACINDIIGSDDNRFERVLFVEPDVDFNQRNIHGFKVIPQSLFDPADWSAIVSISDPKKRENVVSSLPINTHYATVVHPSAVISEWISLGEGSIVTAGSILTCDISVGRHSQLNLHTTIGHDTHCDHFFTTAPGVNVSGICKIGKRVYLGTNASIKQGLSICDDIVIGMGSVVLSSIDIPGIYVGNPLRKLEK
ncbi:NeuD/PglB/VioB family sugar acetyltransferase [Leptospira sp. WS92.C1]